MRRLIAFFSFVVIGLISEASLAVEDSLQLFMPATVVLDFDPFTGLPGLKNLDLEFNVPQGKARSVKLIITPEVEADFEFGADISPIELKIETNLGTQIAGKFETLMELEPGQANTLDINFRILAGQYADAGTHGIDLWVNVEDAVTGEALVINRPLHIDCVVPSRAQTNFAGTTPGFDNGIGIATLDFGEITFGDSRQVQFQIRGNSDVVVQMTSENNGYMVNKENSDISPIPYTVDADGVVSDMKTPLTFTRQPEKSLLGSRYPLTVTIEEPEGGAFAGQYHDILSIDVSPQ